MHLSISYLSARQGEDGQHTSRSTIDETRRRLWRREAEERPWQRTPPPPPPSYALPTRFTTLSTTWTAAAAEAGKKEEEEEGKEEPEVDEATEDEIRDLPADRMHVVDFANGLYRVTYVRPESGYYRLSVHLRRPFAAAVKSEDAREERRDGTSADRAAAAASGTEEIKEGEWLCPQCTFRNPPSAFKRCEMCSRQKDDVESAGVDTRTSPQGPAFGYTYGRRDSNSKKKVTTYETDEEGRRQFMVDEIEASPFSIGVFPQLSSPHRLPQSGSGRLSSPFASPSSSSAFGTSSMPSAGARGGKTTKARGGRKARVTTQSRPGTGSQAPPSPAAWSFGSAGDEGSYEVLPFSLATSTWAPPAGESLPPVASPFSSSAAFPPTTPTTAPPSSGSSAPPSSFSFSFSS